MSHNDDKGQEYKLFVGGLHLNTTTESLRDFYSKWGEIVDAIVMKDPNTKRSRGFGFVTYATDEQMRDCMDNRPHNIEGREVEAKYAIPKESSSQQQHNVSSQSTKKVFLGGLHLDTSESDIRDALGHYGAIEEIVIKTAPDTDRPRGFGFAIFVNCEDVERLCRDRFIKILDRDVEVKKAQSAEDMRHSDGGGRGYRGGHGYSNRGDRGGMYDHQGGRGGGGGGGMQQYAREAYSAPYRGYPQAAGGYGFQPSPYGTAADYYRESYGMSVPPGYAAAYGNRSMYSSQEYRDMYETAAANTAAVAAYSMYNTYGGAASGYGPMRGYGAAAGGQGGANGGGGQGGGGGGGMPEQNVAAAYGGRNTGGRVYHPYKR